MRRGDIVAVALRGDQGKPRPALVVQADLFSELPAVTILPMTGTLIDATVFRVQIEPSAQNGLAKRSQVMVDKAQTPARDKVGAVIGRLDDASMLAVTRAMAVFLGLG